MASKTVGRPVIKVGVATSDWSSSVFDESGRPVLGGAGWIRFGQWARLGTNHVVLGQAASIGDRLAVRTHDTQAHVDCSTVILQRQMRREIPGLIRSARASGQRVINDVDDWFWGVHPDNQAAAYVDPTRNPDSNIDHYRDALEASDLVTVSTPFLADRFAAWGIPVRVIENRVAAYMFPTRRHRSTTPTIGWVGSTGHRSGDLAILREPLTRLTGPFVLHHTGDHPLNPSFADEVGVAADTVSTLPMLAPHEYPHGFRFDIGVVPLTDVEFNHAKSWIKGLEYAAAGVPFVASPSPEYLRLRDQYGIGRIASTPTEWVDHFDELRDPMLRAEEAARQRAIVDTAFHVKQMAREFDDAVWS